MWSTVSINIVCCGDDGALVVVVVVVAVVSPLSPNNDVFKSIEDSKVPDTNASWRVCLNRDNPFP